VGMYMRGRTPPSCARFASILRAILRYDIEMKIHHHKERIVLCAT
jgi:hypothetical protein